MRMSKGAIIEAIRGFELAEYAMYAAGMVPPMEHVTLCASNQMLIRRVEESNRMIYEVNE